MRVEGLTVDSFIPVIILHTVAYALLKIMHVCRVVAITFLKTGRFCEIDLSITAISAPNQQTCFAVGTGRPHFHFQLCRTGQCPPHPSCMPSRSRVFTVTRANHPCHAAHLDRRCNMSCDTRAEAWNRSVLRRWLRRQNSQIYSDALLYGE